jgi:hypothetical protein
MKRSLAPARLAARFVVAALVLLFSADVGATNYTLWIHGRNSGGAVSGNYADFKYWGPATTAAGVNKRAVNWDGRSSISAENGKIRNALDCFCTGSNWCYINVHSAGDMHIGYALSLFGNTDRSKKDARPGADGVCGNTDGTKQRGWNIKWVHVASGASGGSELADIGGWATGEPLSTDLKTANARVLYNHNNTAGVTFFRYAGAKGGVQSALMPGEDDGAVAYHTTGGCSAVGRYGNKYERTLFTTTHELTLGTAACGDGTPKWNNHTVALRDASVLYDHFANGNWLGIIGPVRSDAVLYAY